MKSNSAFPFALVALLTAFFLTPAHAQGPSADWRTLTTSHFRVHYPAPSEAWARRAAARLDSIREQVVTEVGYAPLEVVDVLVSDPIANPNGQAFPFLGWPRMILWTSPPGPESEIGHYTDWTELVAIHEETHLVHLLRRSRNPARRLLEDIVPLGPIPASAPRWVIEGYATVVEGRLTSSGRPYGDIRAAILRRWAQGGKLPSYSRLAADSESWRGMSMAYLLGSAYLEWLEERAGTGSLRSLWARMTARTSRGFDEAFRGVFGDPPADLYDRFRAELTWRAIETERRSGPQVEGEPWQDLSWSTGAPAVSPDGTRLAAVVNARARPARLIVWSTAPDTEAEKKLRQKVEKSQEEDPEDVPAVRSRPLPRKILYTYQSPDGPEPTTPRWMPDGKSLVFVRFEPDADGFLHPDLYRWTPESGEVHRITHAAGLRDPDPAPDGGWAVAVRNRDGLSQIVRVDLATGELRALTEPTAEEVYDRPRVAPDGSRIAYALHREGVWRLVIQDLDGGKTRELAPPPEGTVSSPAWSADGRTLYAAVGLRGFIDLWAFPLTSVSAGNPVNLAPFPLTRTQGAALAPAPTPDGSGLFFLSLQPAGFDLRCLPLAKDKLAAAPPPPADLPRELSPAIRPPTPPAPAPLDVAEVSPGRHYGRGRQELFPLLSGSATSSGGVAELGVRGGDVVGRLDWLVLGALGANGWPQGGAFAATWRGWPLEVGAHLFQSRERPSDENGAPAPEGIDLDRQGIELSAGRGWQVSGGRFSVAGRALWDRIDPAGDHALDQRLASLTGAWTGYRRFGPLWRLQPGLSAHYEAGDTAATGGWSRYGGTIQLGISHQSYRLDLSWRRDGSRDLDRSFDRYQLGGSEISLLPESALSNRIAVPALPAGTLLGDEHEEQRAMLSLGFLPAPLFYERHRLWSRDGAQGDWLSLAGLQYRFNLGPIPVGRLPVLDLELGVARILDDPTGRLKNDTRWWVITVLRP
jgi:hypothetical protein